MAPKLLAAPKARMLRESFVVLIVVRVLCCGRLEIEG
jgi:hypothetical protein